MDQKGWEQYARDKARIPPMLAGLVDWCNANLPLDPRKPVTAADIAHVSLTAAEFIHVPGQNLVVVQLAQELHPTGARHRILDDAYGAP